MMYGIAFFERHQKILGVLSAAYVLFLLLAHQRLGQPHVWVIACFFSILMNFTYVFEAYAQRAYLRAEACLAGGLICLSVMGVLINPLFVILAIFGHGVWDISKHRGAGIPFVSWYTLGCSAIDFTYGTVLSLYWMTSR